MNRKEKEILIEELKGIFQSSAAGVLVDFSGLTVEELTNLRKKLYEQQASFRVLKNTLARIAAKGTPFEDLISSFKENRALVYSQENPISPAKTIVEGAKDNEKLKLINGMLVTDGTGKVLSSSEVASLAALPSKEELIVKLLFLLNSPITQFVRTINEVPSKFARTLQAVVESKK